MDKGDQNKDETQNVRNNQKGTGVGTIQTDSTNTAGRKLMSIIRMGTNPLGIETDRHRKAYVLVLWSRSPGRNVVCCPMRRVRRGKSPAI